MGPDSAVSPGVWKSGSQSLLPSTATVLPAAMKSHLPAISESPQNSRVWAPRGTLVHDAWRQRLPEVTPDHRIRLGTDSLLSENQCPGDLLHRAGKQGGAG